VASDRLSQDEVALVLRRAAELDRATTVGGDDDRLPVESVEAAALEVGLAPDAVRRALAELRAGMLDPAPGDAAVPATQVIEAAVVPQAPEEALAAVGRWLSAQTFHRHRGRDGVEVWRAREDWIAGMQRAFDWSASVRLKDVREVVVRAVTVEGGTLLRLEATLQGPTAAAPVVGAGGGGVVGGGAGMAAGMLFLGGPPTVLAAAAAVAGVGAAGGWWAGRQVRRRRSTTIADELSAGLDRIATGQLDAGAIDRLRSRARRLHGPRA
jgi:hypothetical protein